MLGADTLCWHLRLERGDLTLEDVLDEAAAAGAEFIQLTLHHAREREAGALGGWRAGPVSGLRVLASGDFLGGARFGDPPRRRPSASRAGSSAPSRSAARSCV